MAKKKMIEYEIKAKIWFDMDENTEIEDYLDNLRGIGEAEVVDVRVVEKNDD